MPKQMEIVQFALIAAASVATLVAQEDSRQAAISAAQHEKATHLTPEQPNKVERGLLRFSEEALLQRMSNGIAGFRPKFGGLAPGSGFAVGPEYRRTDLLNGELTFRASAQVSFRGYQKYDLELAAPRLSGDRFFTQFNAYSDSKAEEWVVRCLIERRKKVLNAYLSGTGGLDGFAIRDNRLDFHAVGVNPINPEAVQVEWSVFDNASGRHEQIAGGNSLALPHVSGGEYLVAKLTGTSGPPTFVFVRTRTDRKLIVGVERQFAAIQQGE